MILNDVYFYLLTFLSNSKDCKENSCFNKLLILKKIYKNILYRNIAYKSNAIVFCFH